MILLTKTTVGTAEGPLQIRNYQMSGDFSNSARLSRSKLLGGGCSFSHYGTSDSDRDFDVDCRLTPDEVEAIQALFRASDLVKIAFWEGFFLGYIFKLTIRRNGEANIKFYFKEKLA